VACVRKIHETVGSGDGVAGVQRSRRWALLVRAMARNFISRQFRDSAGREVARKLGIQRDYLLQQPSLTLI